MPFVSPYPHTFVTHAERATQIGSLIGLNKGRNMNSMDILIGLAACGLGFLFMVVGYAMGYREGHGEGYLRGRAIAKALKEKELI